MRAAARLRRQQARGQLQVQAGIANPRGAATRGNGTRGAGHGRQGGGGSGSNNTLWQRRLLQ